MSNLLEQLEDDCPATDTRPFQEWDPYVVTGERILWDGAPALNAVHRNRLNSVKIIGWGCFALAVLMFLVPLTEMLEENAVELARTITFVSGLTGIAVMTLGPKLVKRSGVHTTYAISNRHAIILRHRPELTILRYPAAKMDAIALVHDTFDSVYFARRVPPQDQWQTPWEAIPDTNATYFQMHPFQILGFEQLEDGTEAYHTLNAAKDALK